MGDAVNKFDIDEWERRQRREFNSLFLRALGLCIAIAAVFFGLTWLALRAF